MDIVFAFIQPYIDFCIDNYWTVLIVSIVLITTVVFIIQHLDSSTLKDLSFDPSGVMLFITAVIWPISLVLIAIVLIVCLYFYLIGILVRLVKKRIS